MPADVSELEALAARLKAAGVRVRREQSKVVQETTTQVAESAKGLAPIGPTGNLRGSITGSARGLRGRVEATARYAQFVEYGTYKDRPQPFMTPALEQGTGSYLADSLAAAKRAMDL